MTDLSPTVDRLAALLEKANLGQLAAVGGHVEGMDGDTVAGCYYNAAHGRNPHEVAALIAEAITALPALLARVRESEADAARLDWLAQYGVIPVDSVTGEPHGNGQRVLAASRKNVDAARVAVAGEG